MSGDWSSDVCSSDLFAEVVLGAVVVVVLRVVDVGLGVDAATRSAAGARVAARVAGRCAVGRKVGVVVFGGLVFRGMLDAGFRSSASARAATRAASRRSGGDTCHPASEIGRASCRERVYVLV